MSIHVRCINIYKRYGSITDFGELHFMLAPGPITGFPETKLPLMITNLPLMLNENLGMAGPG